LTHGSRARCAIAGRGGVVSLCGIARTHPPLSTRFTVDDGHDVPLGHDRRPFWRGRVHLFALWLALPAMAVLVGAAGSPHARIGCAIYALGLCSMFAVSTAYHRWVHGLRARAAWRRADHATIFAAIAGSATPLALVTMAPRTGLALVIVLWATALPGVLLKLGHWHHGDVAGTVLYFVLSAECIVLLPALHRAEGALPVALCFASGGIYIVGAILFGLKRPALRPGVFGFHEFWHLMTVIAAATHFVAVCITCA
jgi:hemolysin III